ncbi:MAG: redoxin domain-containing protein, partial [Deltaproteobacteria bacterium]|nr:redoxin domain-containing protein [Deltaproteobacteria bacterium]
AVGLAVVVTAGCNSITGASSIEIDAELHGSTGNGWGDADGVTVGPTGVTTGGSGEVASVTVTSSVAGSGGATASSSSVTGGGGSTASSSAVTSVVASSVAASSVVSSSVASTAASTGSGGPVSWPAGPYGVNTGKTVPEKLAWDGYPEGNGGSTTLAIKDWYDPDGSKEIHAILVITSQYGCGPCTQEAKSLEAEIKGWKSQGLNIKVITLIIDDPYGGYPDVQAAGQWKTQYGLLNVAVGADPDYAFAASSSFATPQQTVVNPRTMKVVSVHEGYNGDYSKLENLALSNL